MAKLYLPEGLSEGDEWEINVDRAGLWTGRQRFWCHVDDLGRVMPAPGSEHPRFNFLFLDSARAGYHPANGAFIDATYAGLNATFGGNDPTEPIVEYWLDVTTSDEPLATHPRYSELDVADIAEAVTLALDPPKEADGESLKEIDTSGWAANKVELYEKLQSGIESYRDPKVIWGARWVSDSLPTNLNATGKIDTPSGDPPSVAADRSWMYLGARTRIRGLVYEIEESWELSGRGGWDPELYADE